MVGNGPDRRWIIDEDTFLYSNGVASSIMRDGRKVRGFEFATAQIDDVHPASYNVAERLKVMDEQGIFAQIAYPNILGFSGQNAMKTDADLRLASMQIFNDAMGEMQTESSDRILPMAMMPWWDVKESVKEIERCLAWGVRGINWNPDTHSHGLPSIADPYWSPLWEVCSAHGLSLNFHIGASDESVSWFATGTLPHFSMDEKLAMGTVMLFIANLRVLGNILTSRFLENWPDLKIVSVESGVGWMPYMIEALEYMSVEAGLKYAIPPSEILRRQIYGCFFFERENLVETVRQVGADNVVFESDFPHAACLYPDSREYLADAIGGLTREERFKIFSGNAAKIYNIDIH
jgi:predicted TIM-barrel fold metal-dependent hydrolase